MSTPEARPSGDHDERGVLSGALVSGRLTDFAGAVDDNVTLASGAAEALPSGAFTYGVTIDAGAVLSGSGVLETGVDYGTVSGVSIGRPDI